MFLPIIMIANELPRGVCFKGALRERFMRLRFINVINELDEGRIIATLFGCIRRRLVNMQSSPVNPNISIS